MKKAKHDGSGDAKFCQHLPTILSECNDMQALVMELTNNGNGHAADTKCHTELICTWVLAVSAKPLSIRHQRRARIVGSFNAYE